MQKLIDILYRNPRAAYKNQQRFGGILAYRRMMQSQKKMINAAIDLPPVKSFAGGLPVYFLTGKNYLYQTLFCIASLARVTLQEFQFILVDDGSFNEQMVQQVARQLPRAQIFLKPEIEQQLAERLPIESYPALNKKRLIYPHLKKLTDVHILPGNDWKLVLDSDMLFWQEPAELLNWLKKPVGPLYMVDQVESYGYSTQLMKNLCGHDIPNLLNVGAIGLNSNTIIWDNLEQWLVTLEKAEGTSYYLEQALSAMLVAGLDATVLHRTDYIVNPLHQQVVNQKGILHHYVDLSKKDYFNYAWQQIKTI